MSSRVKTADRSRPGSEADLALVRAAGAGDESARRELAQRMLERVRITVRYLCGRRSDASDIVGICLIEVVRSAGSYRGDSQLTTWVDRVTVRTAMREIRRQQKRRDVADDRVGERLVERDDPETVLDGDRLRRAVAGLLDKLDVERREVMVLRVVHGYTMPEIAALTDTKLETVQSRYKMARKQLRRLVKTDDVLREWAKTRVT